MSLNYCKDYNQEIREWLLKVFSFADSLSKESLHQRPCPVCCSTENTFFANNNYLDYVKCNNCELIYMNPAPLPKTVNGGFKGEDKLLADYFAIMQRYKTGIPDKPDPDNNICDIYALKKTGQLLDVGCSIGDFLHKVKHWYEVEGLEINPDTAAIAEQHFKVHKKFLSELELSADYDIVTLNQILYGVPDPVALLKDVNRVLKDDGIVYINTPNSDSFAVKCYAGQVNHLYGYTTANLFNKRSLEALCEQSGFEIIGFRTEWMDIYLTDLAEYYSNPEQFIHKRNCHLANYEENIKKEDDLQASLDLELGDHGNYLVAVLGKSKSEITRNHRM